MLIFIVIIKSIDVCRLHRGASHVTYNINNPPDDHFCDWLLVCLFIDTNFYYVTLAVDQNELKSI